MKSFHSLFSTFFYRSLTAFIFIVAIYSINFAATQIDISGLTDSKKFGSNVTVLPNGNFVVTDSNYVSGINSQAVGATYLFNGKTGEQISQFKGIEPSNVVGKYGIRVLANGNYLILSNSSVTWCSAINGCSGTISSDNSLLGVSSKSTQFPLIALLPNGNYLVISDGWDNAGIQDVGAVTFGDGNRGVSGFISEENSLVGSSANDNVGYAGNGNSVFFLSNGNYVVVSSVWDDGSKANAGAITWGDGNRGVVGRISESNSLIGSSENDYLGSLYLENTSPSYFGSTFALSNGNYVVASPNWDNGSIVDVGAVTWCDGNKGCVGRVSSINSLVGTQIGDKVGRYYNKLNNSNYVITSPFWNNETIIDAGAVTWGNGEGGTVGEVSFQNSLIGTRKDDFISFIVTPLSNGNYVVCSPYWDNHKIINAGAATWGNGQGGTVGIITPENSLVGTKGWDYVGIDGATALSNGNYVVKSSHWDNNNIANVGAVTWGNGQTGTFGEVTEANSLIGSKIDDLVGYKNYNDSVTALANGNYVVVSSKWDNNAVIDAGAVTWGNGEGGTVGKVSESNSLVGSTNRDSIGFVNSFLFNQLGWNFKGIIPLPNGNYVVKSPTWDNSGIEDAGAVTWGNGQGGTIGTISASNSLVGTSRYDFIMGSSQAVEVEVLPNSNYLVSSYTWTNGTKYAAGFVAWADGTRGVTGVVSQENALVGVNDYDSVGIRAILPDGNYLTLSSGWDNGSVTDVGAVTWGDSERGIKGTITPSNSVIGLNGEDRLGFNSELLFLPNGNYSLRSGNKSVNTGYTINQVSILDGKGKQFGAINSNNTIFFSPPLYYTYQQSPSITYNSKYEYLIIGRPNENKITIFKPTYTAVADGNWTDGNVWDYGDFSQPQDVYIPNGKTVNLDSTKTVNSLQIGCQGNLTGADESSYIIGNVRKDFCQNKQSFSFPVGTNNGYSPVDVNVTRLDSPSSITIKAKQGNRTGMIADNSLQRYWTLNRSGSFLFDAVFHYPESDVVGDESNYNLYRFPTINAELQTPFKLNTNVNTISKTGIANSGDWTIGNAPIGITFGGKVTNASGRSVKDAVVTVTYQNGQTFKTRTNSLGYYKFTGLETGKGNVSVTSSIYTFTPQEIAIDANLAEINFTALP